MKNDLRRRIDVTQKVVGVGKRIFLYKKGSMGEVVGIYDCVSDIVEMEKIFNPFFNYGNVYSALIGRSKYFTSLNHQCRVKPVIKEVNN